MTNSRGKRRKVTRVIIKAQKRMIRERWIIFGSELFTEEAKRRETETPTRKIKVMAVRRARTRRGPWKTSILRP